MSLHRHLYLATYDIRSNRLRTAALKMLRGYATGGQKSVLEIWLTVTEKREVLDQMPHLLEEHDRFCLMRLDPRSRSHMLGTAETLADPAYFYVG